MSVRSGLRAKAGAVALWRFTEGLSPTRWIDAIQGFTDAEALEELDEAATEDVDAEALGVGPDGVPIERHRVRPFDRGDERFDGRGIEEDARGAIEDRVERATGPQCDDGLARAHGLHRGHAEVLLARYEVGVAASEEVGQGPAINPPGESNRRSGERPKPPCLRSVADDDELTAEPARRLDGEC